MVCAAAVKWPDMADYRKDSLRDAGDPAWVDNISADNQAVQDKLTSALCAGECFLAALPQHLVQLLPHCSSSTRICIQHRACLASSASAVLGLHSIQLKILF